MQLSARRYEVLAMEPTLLPARTPSPYERQALHEIHVWKHPPASWLGSVQRGLRQATHEAAALLRQVPGLDYTLDTLVPGVLNVLNEIVQDTVPRQTVLDAYRRAGHPVATLDDLSGLDLSAVDAYLEGFDARFRALAAAEGAATGAAGLPGILPDVVALVALNLRAAGELAAACGFDVAAPQERLFALHVLNAVSSPADAAKQLALTPVIRVSRHLAQDQALRAAEQFALTRALQNAARALGLQLTRAKLAQLVPVVGAAVGAGFNAYYTSKVCDAAFYLYRERFLQRKYGLLG